MLGSKRFSVSPDERRAVLILTVKLSFGGLCAVAGLYLTNLDLGFWNVLVVPIAAGLTDLSLKVFRDTRYESPNPWTAPLSGTSVNPVPWPGPIAHKV